MAGEPADVTTYRVGIGCDVHKLVKGRKLILGGERIKHDKGLEGHSDADVLTHAAMSAILGAMAAGSLGDHFPDTDPQYLDIRSIDLLERVRIMMEEGGYVLENLDTMVICDQPRLAPHIENIRLNLSEALRVPIGRVSVKVTSTEGLGFTGTGEGIATQAVCLLRVPGEESSEPARSREKASAKKRTKAEPPQPLPRIRPGELDGCVARVDGATEGNPGPSGIGILFETSDGVEIGRLAEPIGESTNNRAEYAAAIRAARVCAEWGVEEILIITDSQLLANQVNGSFKIKNQQILKLYYELMEELRKFGKWGVRCVSRDENTEADKLSKLALRLNN